MNKSPVSRSLAAQLSPREEGTLARIAVGNAQRESLRDDIVSRLEQFGFVEFELGQPRLTPLGIVRTLRK